MESTPSYCMNQYNVGVLDGVGVGLLWFYVLRWILLISFNDDINILFCLPNPAEDPFYRGWKHAFFFTIDILIPFGSFSYTIFQAARCGDRLLSCLVVFVNLYEVIFKFTRLKLNLIIFHIYLCCFTIYAPDIIVALSSAMAIGYGGQIRNIGIAGLVIVVLFLGCGYNYRTKEYKTNELRHEINTYKEYILLIIRIITGFGISDISKLLFLKIYRCFKPAPPISDKTLILNELYWWGQSTETIVRIIDRQYIHADGHYEILS
ncbi:hypothetical protein BGZ49_009611 [Haplosporangium sp. Z 27]|nr:hypothetical protein BGZ49_009611 [Haplosporangium sp. Z 27]